MSLPHKGAKALLHRIGKKPLSKGISVCGEVERGGEGERRREKEGGSVCIHACMHACVHAFVFRRLLRKHSQIKHGASLLLTGNGVLLLLEKRKHSGVAPIFIFFPEGKYTKTDMNIAVKETFWPGTETQLLDNLTFTYKS